MILVLPWLIGAGLVGIASAWIFSESEEDKQKREKKEADQQKQREIRNLGANEIWKSIEKLGELLIFKGENIDIEWEKHSNILFQHKDNIDDLKDDIKKLMDFMRMLESLNHIWQEIKEKSKVIKKNYPYTELGKELNGSNSQKIDRLNNWKTLSNHINPDMNDLKFLLGEKEDQLEKELNKKAEEERIQMLINVGIDSIDKMDGFDFEKLLLTHFTRMGYKGSLTQQTQDFGADLIVMKDDQKHVIQAKRSASPVSVKAVQEIVAAKGYYCADIAIVVTNNFFTENARELAYRNKVELWDREKLIQFIVQSKKVNKESTNEQ